MCLEPGVRSQSWPSVEGVHPYLCSLERNDLLSATGERLDFPFVRCLPRTSSPCRLTTFCTSCAGSEFPRKSRTTHRVAPSSRRSRACSSRLTKSTGQIESVDWITAIDEDGLPCFDELKRTRRMCAIVFYAFDLLELKGEYLRGSPLLKRRGQELAITTRLILGGFTELK